MSKDQYDVLIKLLNDAALDLQVTEPTLSRILLFSAFALETFVSTLHAKS